jgi:hypothetical protein
MIFILNSFENQAGKFLLFVYEETFSDRRGGGSVLWIPQSRKDFGYKYGST